MNMDQAWKTLTIKDFLTLLFWSVLQPFWHQSREYDRKYDIRMESGLFPHFIPATTWPIRQIFFVNDEILFEEVAVRERILYFIFWKPLED